MHVNLYSSSDYSPPPTGSWNKWGRCIFYVSDVDAMYRLALKEGFKPEMPPSDAPWGERYFQILDPMGHEISLAAPITGHPRWQGQL